MLCPLDKSWVKTSQSIFGKDFKYDVGMRGLRKSQTSAPLERTQQAHFAKTGALFAYWQKLQTAGRPTRASLDPVEMKPYLANLLTRNLELALVAEYSQHDFSNRYLDKLNYSGRDDVDWEARYRQLHATHRPIIGECSLKGAAGRVIASYEYAILPLWRGDDPAGSFLAMEVSDDIDSHRIADWAKVTPKS
jgi:hypothetical protein